MPKRTPDESALFVLLPANAAEKSTVAVKTEIRNRNGSDFELDMIEMKPTVLKRRVGGGNA